MVLLVAAAATADEPAGGPAPLEFREIRRTQRGVEMVYGGPDGFTNRLDVYVCTNLARGGWTLLGTTTNPPPSSGLVWTDPGAAQAPCVFYRLGNADVDSDRDGLPDAREIILFNTNPGQADTDDDGMPDGWEVQSGFDPSDGADATTDTDGDGLANLQEYLLATDPRKRTVRGALSGQEFSVTTPWWGGAR